MQDPVIGKTITSTFSTRDKAEAFELLCTLHRAQGIAMPDAQSVKDGGSVGLFLKYVPIIWGGTKGETSTLKMTTNLVKWFGENSSITSITSKKISEFVEECKRKNNSNSTINRKMSCLSMLLQHAKKMGVIIELPDIPRFKESQGRIRFLTDTERKLVFQTFELFHDHEAIAVTKFLLAQGNRCGEAMETLRNSGEGYPLEWKDISEPWGTAPWRTHVDDKTGVKTEYPVVTFWLTKNGNPRTLPLLKPAQEALEYTKSLGWSKPFEGMTYNVFYSRWRRMRRHLNLQDDPDFVPHMLRHTVASEFVMRGVDLKRVQEWLGHLTIQTTMRYAHLAPSSLFSMIPASDLNRPELDSSTTGTGPVSHLTLVS
tara:strand:+ start:294 stop:1406 length:1113 start_codon:yes stop_codon:yes gene_type:complete